MHFTKVCKLHNSLAFGGNPFHGRLEERDAQKVIFLQKRYAKIYVFAFLSPFAPFWARSRLVFVSFSARPEAHLKGKSKLGLMWIHDRVA